MNPDLTPEQQTRLDELADMYRSTRVRPVRDTLSIYIDCYDYGTPERCVRCGDDGDHLSARYDHPFWVATPAATYRVAPSGFRQMLEPVAA